MSGASPDVAPLASANSPSSSEEKIVAVTGATGFIGQRLVRALESRGCRVRAATRGATFDSPGLEWITTTLDNPAGLDRLLAGADAVIHCAGAVRGARYADFERVNVGGTQAVADAALRCQRPPRMLLLSSLAAREPQLSHYARSKDAAERVLSGLSGLAWNAYRPPAVYGPGDKELRPTLDLMRRRLAAVPGHPGRFSLIYVDDLVAAIVGWLESNLDSGAVFELDDGMREGYDWDEVIAAVSAMIGRRVYKVPLPHWLMLLPGLANLALGRSTSHLPMLTPGKLRELFHPDWVVRDSRLRAALGWQPYVGLAEGLANTFAAH